MSCVRHYPYPMLLLLAASHLSVNFCDRFYTSYTNQIPPTAATTLSTHTQYNALVSSVHSELYITQIPSEPALKPSNTQNKKSLEGERRELDRQNLQYHHR